MKIKLKENFYDNKLGLLRKGEHELPDDIVLPKNGIKILEGKPRRAKKAPAAKPAPRIEPVAEESED